ncbi:hypothetical protein KR222_000286, partial [Zaprionus bogoriensis]
ECTNIDIRNECDNIHQLDNCTVVMGYLMITLLPSSRRCNYTNYTFPKLREVTGFVILTEVRGLYNLRYLFPNLTVIRGRRLFLNYALGVTSMHDLELLEFPSLVAIQRGHVYVGNCHKLCQLNAINWDRLTLSTGENHIVIGSNNCSQRASCKGCASNYCWSNFVCQRFENDNVAHYDRNSESCHEECLGGCYNHTAAGCVVCRGISDAGVCVKQCPPHKYLLEQYQRCYTQLECVEEHRHFTYGSDCVAFCPSGHKPNAESDCVPCAPQEPCLSVCSSELGDGVIFVYNLADAEELRGCQIVNGSLIITIRNLVNEPQLEQSFASLREIRGHLKIYRSMQLSSLRFLRNLQVIHGNPMESNHYALILYDNMQLEDLWTPAVQLELVSGGIYMQRNNKLCNQHMRDFQQRVVHDKTLDSLQTSDQEVFCGPAKLQLSVQVLSHSALQLSWPKAQTSVQLELVYRAVPAGRQHVEQSELDAPICTRINWQRLQLFRDELQDNGTHYTYTLEQLQPSMRYACLLRTFGGDSPKQEARSELLYMRTRRDIPKPPPLALARKTDSALTLLMGSSEPEQQQDEDYFRLRMYELPDDADYIEERNYCKQTAYMWHNTDAMRWRALQEYDYDDCCAHQAEVADDLRFMDGMQQMYRCSLDAPGNCEPKLAKQSKQLDGSTPPSLQLELPGNTTFYELRQLQRYRLYSLQLQACNKLGCSSATTLNERTNFTQGADQLAEVLACRVPKTMKYIMRFAEPAQPNGLIVNYVLHYRNNVSDQVTETHLACVTRREHAAASFVHVARLNGTYNECAVRVHSLAEDVMTPYMAITWCTEEQSKLEALEPAVSEHLEVHSHARGISIFVFCFLFGCGVALVWLLWKRRFWRWCCVWPQIRHYMPMHEQWLREWHQAEDREILVDGFETVRFQNNNNSSSNNNSS